MNTLDLDGKVVEWNPRRHITAKVKEKNKSKLHTIAKKLLKQLLPNVTLLEEVKIPIQKHKTLLIDIYVPQLLIAIEVQGIQHYKHTPFFQKTKLKHFRQLKSDRDKKEWCNTNGILLILLPYDKINEWEQIIKDYLKDCI